MSDDILVEEQTNVAITEPADKEIFFYGGHWGQSLQLLQHLCQYSDQIIVVTGEDGCGKSSLLRCFLQDKNRSFRVGTINATQVSATHKLLSDIANEFEFNLYDTEEDGFNLNTKTIDNKIWILLVDNAEQLSSNHRDILLKLGRPRDDGGQLRIVLFGNNELEKNLPTVLLARFGCDNAHFIEIEPLKMDEVAAFINFLWKKSGNNSQCPITESMIKKIYKLSKGNISKVIKLSEQYIDGNVINKSTLQEFSQEETPKKDKSIYVKSILSLGILFILVGIITFLLWPNAEDKVTRHSMSMPLEHTETTPKMQYPATRKSVSEVVKQHEINLQKSKDIVTAEVTTQSIEDVSSTSHEVAETEMTDNAIALSSVDIQDSINAYTPLSEDKQKSVVAQKKERVELIQEDPPKKVLSKESLAIDTVKPKNTVSVRKAQPTKVKTKTITKDVVTKHNGLAIFNAKGEALPKLNNNYTLQLLGASNETNIKNFIKQNKLEKHAFYYRSHRQGKPWFVLLYGDYATKDAASLEQQKLGKVLANVKPWMRHIDSITNDSK